MSTPTEIFEGDLNELQEQKYLAFVLMHMMAGFEEVGCDSNSELELCWAASILRECAQKARIKVGRRVSKLESARLRAETIHLN
jgi:hypothetical protein